MLIQSVHFTFAPEDADTAEGMLRELQEASRREDGVIGFDVARGRDTPNVFALWEQYRDRAAFDDHRATDHYKRLVLDGVRPLARQRDGEIMIPLSIREMKARLAMSIIDGTLEANQAYAASYDRKLGARPTPKIAVVTCMDPRLSDLPAILGLPQADIDVIRTGGPAVTDDVLAELIVSNRILGTTEIMLLNHTGCGFTTFTDDELNAKLSAVTGDSSPAPMRFFSYKDPEEHTREQINTVRSHPWIAKDVPVRGFVFDVDTGRITEVVHSQQAAAH